MLSYTPVVEGKDEGAVDPAHGYGGGGGNAYEADNTATAACTSAAAAAATVTATTGTAPPDLAALCAMLANALLDPTVRCFPLPGSQPSLATNSECVARPYITVLISDKGL
jgi:hypothetical protein